MPRWRALGRRFRQGDWRDELLRTGIRGKGGQRVKFVRLEPLPGQKHLHAEGETRPDEASAPGTQDAALGARAVVSFGPDHAPMEQRQVARAIEEASLLVPKPAVIVFAAFQFDPEASKDIDETNWPGVTLLKAQMNADLLTDDLKKKRASNESFWLIGQPDVALERISDGEDKGKFRVSVQGFDYYNTKTGNVESGNADRIAVWMLDPDYDGRSLFPRQVFFPMAGAKDGWAKLAEEPQGGDRRDPDGGLPGDRLAPLRARRARARGGQDRGRPGRREPQDRGVGAMKTSMRSGIGAVDDREQLAARIGVPMSAIAAFCDRWQVVELALFGSVLRDDFGPDSDIDVLIRFRTERTPGLFGIAGMEQELADLLARRVDLMHPRRHRGEPKLHSPEGDPGIRAGGLCRVTTPRICWTCCSPRAMRCPSRKACPSTTSRGTDGRSSRFSSRWRSLARPPRR